jgi:hypothetical protein
MHYSQIMWKNHFTGRSKTIIWMVLFPQQSGAISFPLDIEALFCRIYFCGSIFLQLPQIIYIYMYVINVVITQGLPKQFHRDHSGRIWSSPKCNRHVRSHADMQCITYFLNFYIHVSIVCFQLQFIVIVQV